MVICVIMYLLGLSANKHKGFVCKKEKKNVLLSIKSEMFQIKTYCQLKIVKKKFY